MTIESVEGIVARENNSVWDTIFDNVVMIDQPPAKYIVDAFVTTKSGNTYKISGKDFIDLWRSENKKPADDTIMVYCKVNLDFTRMKRDVSRWANTLIKNIENDLSKTS